MVVSSVIVAAEIWYGVENNPSYRSRARTEAFLENLNVLAMEPEVAKIYGKIRAHLKKTGVELGPNDISDSRARLVAGGDIGDWR